MSNSIKVVNTLKDRLVSCGLRKLLLWYCKKYLNLDVEKKYGYINKLYVYPHEHKLFASITLIGEIEPTVITVSYKKEVLDDQCLLTLKEIDSSKPWVNSIVNDLIKKEQPQKKFSALFSMFF